MRFSRFFDITLLYINNDYWKNGKKSLYFCSFNKYYKRRNKILPRRCVVLFAGVLRRRYSLKTKEKTQIKMNCGYIAQEGKNMKNSTRKTTNALAAIIIALIYLPLAFVIGGANGLGEGWKINPRVTSTGVSRAEYGVFGVSYGEKDLSAVYVNLAAVNSADSDGSVSFTLDFITSRAMAEENNPSYVGSGRVTFKVQSAADKVFTWVKLCNKIGGKPAYVRIGTKNSVIINEIAFEDENGGVLSSAAFGAVGWQSGSFGFIPAEKLSLYGGGQALCAVDGSVKSLGTNAVNYGKRQAKLAAAVNSLKNGGSLDDSAADISPLSIICAYAGCAVFGNSLFALNLVNYLLGLLTLYVIYFFAERISGGENGGGFSGGAAAATFVLCGLFVSSLVASSQAVTALPFALLSCAFAFEFFMRDPRSLRFKRFLPLILSGLFFSLALAADFRSIVLLPLISGSIIAGAIKTISLYSGYKKEYGAAQVTKKEKFVRALALTCVTGALSFILLPMAVLMLGYIICYAPYAAAFPEINGDLFAMASANTVRQLSRGGVFGVFYESSRGFGNNYGAVTCNVIAVLSALAFGVWAVISLAGIKKKNKTAVVAVSGDGEETTHAKEKFSTEELSFFAFCAAGAVSSALFVLIIGAGGASSFIYSVAFLCLWAVSSFKLLLKTSEKAAGITAAVLSAACVIVFAAFFCDIAALNVYPNVWQRIIALFKA